MQKNKNLKILFSTPSISRLYTGVFQVEKNIQLNLRSMGVTFEVHSIIDKYTNKDLHYWDSVELYLYKNFGPFKIGYTPLLIKNLTKSEADVGHIHSLWSFTSYALYRWSKIKSKPYLLTANAYLFESALNKSRVKKKIALFFGFRNIIKSASCIQVNTFYEYESIRSLGFKNPICIIPNGVELPLIDNIKSCPPWIKYENTKGKKILLYLSRIHQQKGVDILVDAWKKMSDFEISKEWHLVIVGFNDYYTGFEKAISQKIKNFSLSNSITLLPGQYDDMMNECYSNCDAFILPSFNEGTSIAALNALAFSKVALLTSGCNITESFSLNAAIEIEPNKNSICEGLSKLFHMKESERKIMGLRGRQLVEEKYSWKSVSYSIFKIYEWINNKKKYPIPSSVVLD